MYIFSLKLQQKKKDRVLFVFAMKFQFYLVFFFPLVSLFFFICSLFVCLQNSNSASSTCTGCKSGERASAFCQDCAHYLCTNCTLAHRYMHCFEGHRVEQLGHGASTSPTLSDTEGSCKCIQVILIITSISVFFLFLFLYLWLIDV